jgi:hypothetical protein
MTWNPSTSSQVATPANPSHSPGPVEEKRTPDTSGPPSLAPFAFYDPDGQCWRMSQGTFPWDSTAYTVTWPRWGTTRNGRAYRRPPLVHLISAGVSSLLPTPAAVDYGTNRTPSEGGAVRPSLAQMARAAMWPTPTSGDAKASGSRNLAGSKSHAGVSLTDAVRFGNSSTPRRMVPTPRARDHKGPGPSTRRQGGPDLPTVIMWATPRASGGNGPDYGRATRPGTSSSPDLPTQVGGQLNPTWVEWLMGFPPGWTDCGPSVMPLSPKWPSTSVDASWKEEEMTIDLAPVTVNGNGRLGAWAHQFLEVAEVSAELARTPFVPVSYRVVTAGKYDPGATAANVTAAILTGQELGIEPMASLRSIDVINGTPALRALALRALLQRQGHRIWVEQATNHTAVVAGMRAGDSEVQRITWTMDDARSRNLAGKPNWRTQPRNMLVARATADVARLIAADAILGVAYVTEELEDEDEAARVGPDAPPVVTPTKRTARRKVTPPALAPAVAPVAEDVPPLEEDAPNPPQPVDEPPAAPVEDEPPLEEPPPPPEVPEGPPEVATPDPGPEVPPPPVEDPQGPPEGDQPDHGTLPLFDPDAPAPETATGPAASPGQVRTIQTLFTKWGVYPSGATGRAPKLAYCSNVVGRTVTSSREMTMREAEEVIDALLIVVGDEL